MCEPATPLGSLGWMLVTRLLSRGIVELMTYAAVPMLLLSRSGLVPMVGEWMLGDLHQASP